jgi:hypothetical protein
MSAALCDNYFNTHIAGKKYFSFDDDMRLCALNTAKTDLAACGVGGITENSPEILRSALYEQTLFVLCRQDEHVSDTKEIVSETIDGIGSYRYTPNLCPAFISPRAFALIEAYFKTGKFRLARG